MAPKKKTTPEKKCPDLDLLKKIVDATANEGHTFSSVMDFTHLESLGLIESNSDLMDDDGDVAVRATQAGFDLIYPDHEISMPEPTPAPEAEIQTPAITPAITKGNTMSFVIEDSIEIPTKTAKRGRVAGTTKYPFAQLQVGQSFYVPASEKTPSPAKAMLSAVSAVIRSYANETGTKMHKGKEVKAFTPTRIFEVREVEGGARVWRPWRPRSPGPGPASPAAKPHSTG